MCVLLPGTYLEWLLVEPFVDCNHLYFGKLFDEHIWSQLVRKFRNVNVNKPIDKKGACIWVPSQIQIYRIQIYFETYSKINLPMNQKVW